MSDGSDKPGRTNAALATFAWTILLALLWVVRPPVPHLELPGSVSGAMFSELIEFVVWALLALLVLRRSHEALRVLAERPTRRRLAEGERLQRILTPPAIKTRPPATHKRYRHQIKLADHARLDETNTSDHPLPSSSPVSNEPTIRVLLLGPFEIEGIEDAVGVRTTCQQLIAYLALRRRGAARDELIEAVWPREDPHSARHRLYQNISEARKLLGDALISKRAHYTLDRHKIAIDIDELDQILTELNSIDDTKAQLTMLERALRLFRGKPLAGWNQEWVDSEVEHLRSIHIDLFKRAGHAHLATGDARGALKAAQQGLALDSYNEGLWRLAMQADDRLGQRDSVGRRYEQLRRLLGEQLGLEPESATRALYYELLGQR